jgi:hypothetical protein
MASGSTAMLRRAAEPRPSRLYVFMSGQRGAISATRLISVATGKACHSWSALRTDVLSEIGRAVGSYVLGRSPDWLKMKNPAAPAVKREAEEDWGR